MRKCKFRENRLSDVLFNGVSEFLLVLFHIYLGFWVDFIVADLHAVRRPRPRQGCRADDDDDNDDDVDDDLHAMPLS